MSKASVTKRKTWSIKANPLVRKTIPIVTSTLDQKIVNPNKNLKVIQLWRNDAKNSGSLNASNESVIGLVKSIHSNKWNGYQNIFGENEAKIVFAKYLLKSKLNIKPTDIFFTIGCSQALDVSIAVLASFGANILCPSPGSAHYQSLAALHEVNVKFYKLLPNKNWEIDKRQLESLVDSRTAALVYRNPSHPSGTLFSRAHIQEILEIADKFKLPIIADEINDGMAYSSAEFVAIASLASDVPILVCGSLSHRFMVSGWRFGWVYISDRKSLLVKENFNHEIADLISRTECPNSLIYGALTDILLKTPISYHKSNINLIKENARIIVDGLNGVTGVRPVRPSGGVYVLVLLNLKKFPTIHSDKQFCDKLIVEQSVVTKSGQYFSYDKPSIGIALIVSKRVLREAVKRIKVFAEKYRK